MPEAEAAFEPVALLKALVRSGVDFIVVGGMAATMHGSPVATTDVDIVPRRERANLQRENLAHRQVGRTGGGGGNEKDHGPGKRLCLCRKQTRPKKPAAECEQYSRSRISRNDHWLASDRVEKPSD